MKDVMALCWAAYQGDLDEVQRLVASGVNLDEADAIVTAAASCLAHM